MESAHATRNVLHCYRCWHNGHEVIFGRGRVQNQYTSILKSTYVKPAAGLYQSVSYAAGMVNHWILSKYHLCDWKHKFFTQNASINCESYTKNDSHNYGDSNHSITLEHIVNYDSHCTFRSGVCAWLITHIIWEPNATGVRVWKVAGWSGLQLISLLNGDNCIALKQRIHVPFPGEWSVLNMQLCVTKFAVPDCRVRCRSRGSSDNGLCWISSDQWSSQLEGWLIHNGNRMYFNSSVIIRQSRYNICVETISIKRKSASVYRKWARSDKNKIIST